MNSSAPRETWTFRVMLPAGIEHGGRYMARVLKHLLRAWGVKATAILEVPAGASTAKTAGGPSATPDTANV